MKNDTNCVNLYMEKGQINHWLSMLYSVNKNGLSNSQLESMIKSDCLFWDLNYSDIVEESKIVEIVPLTPMVVEDPHKAKMRQRDREYVFDLATNFAIKDVLNSQLRRKMFENQIRKICDKHGFDTKDFIDFDALPPIEPPVPRKIKEPIEPPSPVVEIEPEITLPVPLESIVEEKEKEIVEVEVKNDKWVIAPDFSKEIVLAVVDEIEKCPKCGREKTEKIRFKASPITKERICQSCYSKERYNIKHQIHESISE